MPRNSGRNRPGNGGGSGGGQQNSPSGGGGSGGGGGGRPNQGGGGQGNSGGGRPNRPRPASPQAIANANRPNQATTLNRPGSAGGGAPGSRPNMRPIGTQAAIANQLQDLGYDPSMASHFGSWGEFQQWWNTWGQINWTQNLGPDGQPSDWWDSDTDPIKGDNEQETDPEADKPEWDSRKEDAFQVMLATWRAYGLDLGDPSTSGSLAALVRDMILNDRHQIEGAIPTAIRQSDVYRARFPGMREMIGRGWNEAQYIEQENQYKARLSNYFGPQASSMWGVNDYANWMTNNVSPDEVDRRMFAGHSWVTQSANAGVKQALKDMYGIDESGILAYVLDPQRAEKLLMQQARAASIRGYGDKLNLTNQQAESLAQSESIMGIDPLTASGMNELSAKLGQAEVLNENDSFLAAIEGDLAYNSADAVEAAFGQADKALASQRRADRERSRFAGSSAVSSGSLARRRAQ